MFDPIKGPSNHYQGPATGLGTEAGDTWHSAVEKINAGFKNIVEAFEGGSEATDPEARKGVAALEEAVAVLQKRDDEREASMKALLGTVDKLLAAAQVLPAVPPAQPQG